MLERIRGNPSATAATRISAHQVTDRRIGQARPTTSPRSTDARTRHPSAPLRSRESYVSRLGLLHTQNHSSFVITSSTCSQIVLTIIALERFFFLITYY